MPTRRGWAALGTGFALWIAARFMGSADLHMVAAAFVVLPFFATILVRWGRVSINVHRYLSAVRVFPGTSVVVSLVIENTGRSTASFLLLEDALPASLGRSARIVVNGIPPRNEQTVSYSVLCRQRGRSTVGPLSISATDPFGLARVRIQTTPENDLIVYPEVEEIEPWRLATRGAGAGESAVRHLHRSAAEFYTMREYVTGDDLRRIHWPSVAKTGQLMIRQDESTRRSWATLFLDNRAGALGSSGSGGFERAVSCTATIGRVLIRAGFSLTICTADAVGRTVSETQLLEYLASAGPARVRGVSAALTNLKSAGPADSTLVVVGALPLPADTATMTKTGVGFGRKLAILIYPVDPATLASAAAAEYETRAVGARTSLQRAGWDVYLVLPNGKLAEAWQRRNPRRAPAIALSSS